MADLTTDLAIFLNDFIQNGGSSGGTPGGSNTQIQYNNAGAFGGVTGFTWNGSALTIPAATMGDALTLSASGVIGATANPAATGVLRVSNNDAAVVSRNAGNTADVNLVRLFGATVQIGTSAVSTELSGLWTLSSATGNLSNSNREFAIAFGGDVFIRGDAANVLAQRNGTAAQEFRPYGYYSSATSFATGVVKSVKEQITLSGATTATTNIIPAGAFVIGVATTVTTTVTGASGYTVGDGSDVDRWGDITGTAVGTDSDNTNSTANPTGYVAAASAVTLTAKTSNFTGGVVQVVVFYLTTGAD